MWKPFDIRFHEILVDLESHKRLVADELSLMIAEVQVLGNQTKADNDTKALKRTVEEDRREFIERLQQVNSTQVESDATRRHIESESRGTSFNHPRLPNSIAHC
jgi:hypothetical protein